MCISEKSKDVLTVPEREFSHEEVMENLRKEIEELEQRLRRRGPPEDSGRILPPRRDDDTDDSPPSVAHANVTPDARTGILVSFPIVPESPLSDETLSTTGPTTKVGQQSVIPSRFSPCRKLVLLSKKVLRRVMAAKESLFKFGTFVPKNEREAESSPEAARWKAGRNLEWVRLNKEETFDGDWTWEKVQKVYPEYKRADVGFLFCVYDFKFSGEHRVRLVFDRSRQSETTYKETYAPTVRAKSVHLFHIFCVEEGLHIGQYDVPQAFLKADIDHDIFVIRRKVKAIFLARY